MSHGDTSGVYVANCTLQNQMFQYNTHKGGKLIPVPIRMGQQVKLPSDLTNMEVAHIETMHRPYGLRLISEVKNLNTFVGLVMSVGKPVPLGVMGDTIEHNREKLVERGKELRKEAAVAAATTMSGENPEFKTDPRAELNALEVEIKEEEKPGRDTELDETIRVTNNREEAESGRGRRGNRRR